MNNNMENNNKSTLLTEGALNEFLRAIFGKGFKSSIGIAAEAILTKAVNDIVKGGSKFTVAALRKTPEFATALKDLTAEACRVKYQKTFLELNKFDANAAKKLVTDVQNGIEKEVAERAALGKTLSDDAVKTSTSTVNKVTKDVNLGKATQADLKAATKELKANVKAQTKWTEAQKAIAGMDKMTVGKIQKLISGEAKVTTGTGATIAGGVGPNVVVQTKTGIFSMTKEQLKKFPGTIKKVIVNNKIKSALIAAGLGIAALYYFFPATDDSSTVLVDENGNPIDDTKVEGEWLPCIQKMIASKEGTIETNETGHSVLVKPADFPGGLRYYPDGKVLNVANGDEGTYVCKDAEVVKPTINEVVGRILRERLLKEQTEAEVDDDVETMIDLLDFPVTGGNMQDALKMVQKYAASPMGKEFLLSYKEAGVGGGDLKKSLGYIMTTAASSSRAKRTMLSLISQIESGAAVVTPPAPTPDGGGTGTVITWNKDKKTDDGGGGTVVKKKSIYHDCESKDFPLEYGCKSSKIAEIQKCLGVADDSKFGPNTMKALVDNKYDTSKGISKDVYDAVKGNCSSTPVERKKLDTTPIETIKSSGLKMSSLAPVNIKPIDTSQIEKMIQSNRPPIDYYNLFKEAGNIRGDASETTLEDGTVIAATKRVKYKGDELSSEILGKLDGILSANGYERIKQKTKDYGEKYVWLQK
jgi:hypothetical protein